MFSYFLLMPVLPLYARRLGLSGGQIGIVIGAFALSSMVLRPWAGWASDRHGRRPLMFIGGAVFMLAPLGYGVSAGVVSMTLARLLRCQPFGTSGIDNVPTEKPPGACWYLPWRYGRWRGVNAP